MVYKFACLDAKFACGMLLLLDSSQDATMQYSMHHAKFACGMMLLDVEDTRKCLQSDRNSN
jgi:hypothetical protein